jgi:hypothetical protein
MVTTLLRGSARTSSRLQYISLSKKKHFNFMTGQHLIAKTMNTSQICVHVKLKLGYKQNGTSSQTHTG